MRLLLGLAFFSGCLVAHAQQPVTDCTVTVIETTKGTPRVLIEQNGTLYSLGIVGDSIFENRKLGIHAALPRGMRAVEFENFIQATLRGAGLAAKQILFLHSIYFDFNSALIRNDASAELDKLVKIMQRYPFAQTQAIVHSDSRGSTEYNRKLATKRGQSIKNYLANAGISLENFQLIISGEEELITDCPDKATCDEMLHQANRSAEFYFNPLPKP